MSETSLEELRRRVGELNISWLIPLADTEGHMRFWLNKIKEVEADPVMESKRQLNSEEHTRWMWTFPLIGQLEVTERLLGLKFVIKVVRKFMLQENPPGISIREQYLEELETLIQMNNCDSVYLLQRTKEIWHDRRHGHFDDYQNLISCLYVALWEYCNYPEKSFAYIRAMGERLSLFTLPLAPLDETRTEQDRLSNIEIVFQTFDEFSNQARSKLYL